MTTYFSAAPEDINRLPPEGCARVFGDMLKAEAFDVGIPVTAVTVGPEFAPDGGIDARVRCESPASGHLIVGRNPSYQIKSGDGFAPWRPSAINRDLFGDKERKAENLGAEARRCFENGYPYILVCMKAHLTPEQKERALNNLKAAIKECGLPAPAVEVWGQDHVLTCLNRFLALALRVNGRGRGRVAFHRAWSERDDMKRSLETGREQDALIKKIRDSLRRGSEPIHINVYGETGVGKTRLVLEATRAPDLEPLVVYCDSPKMFYDSPLREIRGDGITAILVIDDCLQDDIWERVRELGAKIKLVTISNERRRIRYAEQMEVTRLSDSSIGKIILGYYPDNIVAGKLSSMCGGIPRFAHIVGFDAQNNPDDLLGGASMEDILERYIRHGDEPNPEQSERVGLMLSTFALFKRFGHGRYFKDESRAVLGLVRKLDQNVTPAFCEETIDKLKARKILQGEEKLYLTPKVLHVWLWARWWRKYQHALDVTEIVKDLPYSLAEAFYGMFEYSARSPVARSTLRDLFGESGPLRDPDALGTENGSRLFHALSRADPHAATGHLERTMGKWTGAELHSFTEGRRHVIYGLERIMFEPDLFVRGGRLLRALAEAENEEWANNATGTFCDMFSLGTGYLSNTRAAPANRLPLLRETLCSRDAARRSLGLRACASALKVKEASISSLAHDYFELESKGWEPASVMQLQESYQNVMDLLCEKIKEFSGDDRLVAAKMILDSSRPLLRALPGMAGYITDRMVDLRSVAGDEAVLRAILEVVEFDGEWLDPGAVARLEQIERAMEDRSYSALMRRYVMMEVLADPISKKYERSRRKKIKELARESVDGDELRPHLGRLVTADAKGGGEFGYELFLQDANESLLSDILAAQRNAGENGSGFFLSGYLAGIFKRDRERWNEIMHEVAEDEKLRRFLIELANRSGTTDEIGMLILDLVRDGRLPAEDLAGILPTFPNKPSPSVVQGWIEAMVEDGSLKSIASALRMFYSLFVRRKMANQNAGLMLRLVTHDALFEKRCELMTHPMTSYYWKANATELIERHGEESLRLCDKILENVDSSLPTSSWMEEVLGNIASKYPNGVWDRATLRIGKPLDKHGYAVSNWMRGGAGMSASGFLELVDHKRIFDWIGKDPSYRAPHMARYAPPLLKRGSVAMELLRRYGDNGDVSRNLLANFMTGFFVGSLVEHYRKSRATVLEYKKAEPDENTNRWLDSYLEALDAAIEKETVLSGRMPV